MIQMSQWLHFEKSFYTSLPDDSSRGGALCLRSSPEFGFLLMPDFLILSASFLLMAYGCSSPMVYLVPYALSVGVEHQHAAFLMSIFGVSVIVGNITFGWITDRKWVKGGWAFVDVLFTIVFNRLQSKYFVWFFLSMFSYSWVKCVFG